MIQFAPVTTSWNSNDLLYTKLSHIIPQNYTPNISTAFGLTLDAFKKPQSNKFLSIISQTLYLDM